MHTRSKKNRIVKQQRQKMCRLQRKCQFLSDKVTDGNFNNDKITDLLGTACKYCNNLENHLKSKGYSRLEIELIKQSNPNPMK